MNLDGSTSGGDYRIEARKVLSDGTICTLWTEKKHCPRATRMRLRRLPEWIRAGCFVSRAEWKLHIASDRSDAMLIARLERKGHSTHCAKRQVWGDGECEQDHCKV